MIKIKKFFSQDTVIAIILFLIAAGIRTIPEIKAGIWPIGYDTFNTYVAEIISYHGPLIEWLKTANLIYFIFLPFKIIGIRPELIIKIFGPVFFGVTVTSFYLWARYFIKFNPLKAFLAGLLIIFQLATLRLSWDLYRNELGLIFFFFACINLAKIEKNKNLILLMILAILIVFSNELVSAILILILTFYLIKYLLNKNYIISKRILLPFLLTSILFYFIINSSGQKLYDPHIIFTSENNYLIWRYFYAYEKDMSYQQLFKTIMALFCLFYEIMMPFVLLGFWLLRKNFILTVLTLWLLAGTFSSLIFAGKGIIVWDRWLIMLVFPFTIYAVEALSWLGKIISLKLKKWHYYFLPTLWTLAVVFWITFLGTYIYRSIPFLTSSYADAKAPLADVSINNYFPRTMVHNSVGMAKFTNLLEVIDWLDKNVPSGAAVIVDNRWRGLMLTHFNLDDRYIITNAWSQEWPRQTFEFAVKNGFTKVYLIWDNSKNIRYFNRVFNSGYTAIYESKPIGQN